MKEEVTKKIRPWNHKIKYSFEQWCLDNGHQDFLERWDYELNEKKPNEVGYTSHKKYWFKCPSGMHESELKDIAYLARNQKSLSCKKCNSFAQYVVNTYGTEYFNKLQNINPTLDLWSVTRRSAKEIKVICRKKESHIYNQKIDWFYDRGCPYCSHRTTNTNLQIDPDESLGIKYPQAAKNWSSKNTNTPYDYYPYSGENVWWKCENGTHEDYQRVIKGSILCDFRCPICGIENKKVLRGEESLNWKGGITKEADKIRNSASYGVWRKTVFENDDYTCQCCGKQGGTLNVHHIKSFSNYPNLRTDVSNGITMCETCHKNGISNSFHTIYGTINTTPEQLEEYINNKRKELGINIPFSIKNY